MKHKVGIVGLGAMGQAMAGRLIRAGWHVGGVDIDEKVLDRLKSHGGHPYDSPAALAADFEVLLLMVVNGDQAETVLFGENGAADALSASGGMVVCGCTQPPDQALRTGDRLQALHVDMLDSPVSGGVVGAKAGTLSVMASGPEAAFRRVAPLMEIIGERIYHVGTRHGQGSTVKMINQLLCGVHIVAAAEALTLGARAGVDGTTLLDVFGHSAASSWMLNDRGPRMLQEDPEVTSAVDIFVKDLGIVQDHCRAERHPAPLAAAALQMFLAASGLGHARTDDSHVIRAYEALSGVTVPKSPGEEGTER